MLELLNIDKPGGISSRDVVNRVEHLVRPVKVGHAGTLDPLATGVLVLCLGSATRLIRHIQDLPKQYRATFLLGRESESDDVETEVRELPGVAAPTAAEIAAVLPEFVGALQQRPPAFSAIKVRGQRAYALARQKVSVELAPRPVNVYALQLVAYAYPELVLDISCGGGTYVRALGRDLAQALGTAAVMSQLTRTAVGSFTIDQACPLDRLTPATLPRHLWPGSRAVAHLPALILTPEEIRRVTHGMTIMRPAHPVLREAAGFDAAGHLIAVLLRRDDDWLRPAQVFAPITAAAVTPTAS